MAGFQIVIKNLRRAEADLEKQLENVRSAIASLSGGTGAARRGRPAGSKNKAGKKKRKPMSKVARAKIAAAQKKRWAAKKAGEKK